MHRPFAMMFALCLCVSATCHAQSAIPDWCRALPRPEYKSLERVQVRDPWFEVYKPAAGVFAIYEPHQSEETIGYLITGHDRAILFDTGMGISDVKKLTTELTKLPIIVLNSHTHDDHVGGNWEFDTVYSMDTDFTRQNARGSKADAQAEIAPGEMCGNLPAGFDAKSYQTRPWKITRYIRDGERIDLGGRTIEVIATPGHTPDAISLLDRANRLLFTGDTYYPAPIWLYRPETDLDRLRTVNPPACEPGPASEGRSGSAQRASRGTLGPPTIGRSFRRGEDWKGHWCPGVLGSHHVQRRWVQVSDECSGKQSIDTCTTISSVTWTAFGIGLSEPRPGNTSLW